MYVLCDCKQFPIDCLSCCVCYPLLLNCKHNNYAAELKHCTDISTRQYSLFWGAFKWTGTAGRDTQERRIAAFRRNHVPIKTTHFYRLKNQTKNLRFGFYKQTVKWTFNGKCFYDYLCNMKCWIWYWHGAEMDLAIIYTGNIL